MIPTIYIHHDAYMKRGHHLAIVNTQHRRKKYPKSSFGYFVFYQYFIEKSGKTVQTRPDMDETVVFKDAHENSISICLAGNFNSQGLTKRQVGEIIKIFALLKHRYGITALHIKDHRSYQNTTCPGNNIPKGYFVLLFIASQYPLIQRIIFKLLAKLRGII